MSVSDVIEREIVLAASREEVWAALTTPAGLAGWWCDRVEIELRPGGTIVFDFGEHGTYDARVEVVEPEERFVFSGRPFNGVEDAEQVPDLRTSAEFRLEDHAAGTLLRLRETGFAALPAALAAKTLGENEGAWDQALERLRTYLATDKHVTR